MLELDVQEYCLECPAFDPVKHVIGETYKTNFGEEINVSTTYVRCRDWKRCKQIERYLRKELENANGSQGTESSID